MALIKSSLLSSIRGSIGGTTYATNRYGMYARNRTTIANPNTGNQIAARGALGNSAQAWRNLTAEQQLGWINYAAATPVPNRLGDMIHMSGINAYVKQASFMLFNSGTPFADPPATPGLATAITEADIDIDDTPQLSVNNLNGPAANPEDTYGFWISGPVSPGVQFYKGPWTYLGTAQGDDYTGPYPIPFAVTIGQKFFVRVRYVAGLAPDAGKTAPTFIIGPETAVAAP